MHAPAVIIILRFVFLEFHLHIFSRDLMRTQHNDSDKLTAFDQYTIFFQNPLRRLDSGGMLILNYTTKIVEINGSDP